MLLFRIFTYIIFSLLLSIRVSAQNNQQADTKLIEEVFTWLNSNNRIRSSKNPTLKKLRQKKADFKDIERLINDLEELGYYVGNKLIPVSYNSAKALLNEKLIELSPNEFKRYKGCKGAKLAWNVLLNRKIKKNSDDYQILTKFEKKLKFKTRKFNKWIKNRLEQLEEKCINSKEEPIIEEDKYQILCESIEITNIYNSPPIKTFLKETFSLYQEYEDGNLDTIKIKELHYKLNDIHSGIHSASIPCAFYTIQAMIEVMYYPFKPTSIRKCNLAHRNWYNAMKGWNACEEERINRYAIHYYDEKGIDSLWVAERWKKTKECATDLYVCCKDITAINKDTFALNKQATLGANKINVISDNTRCVYKGCTCIDADNYDPKASVLDTCYFTRCLDSLYSIGYNYFKSEQFNIESKKGIIIHSDRICKTSKYIGGCTERCDTKYDSLALVNDGSCLGDNVCGCLVLDAVNYAKDPNAPSYYNPKVTKNDSLLCTWNGIIDRCLNPEKYDNPAHRHRFAKYSNEKFDTICACMDTLALSYNSNATHHVSDSCKYYDLEDIERLSGELSLDIEGYASNAQELAENLTETFENLRQSQVSLIEEAVSFSDTDGGNSLQATFNFDLAKISKKTKRSGLSLKQDGIPLGLYNYKPVNSVIRTIITFLQSQSPYAVDTGNDFYNSKMTGIIVGEADGNPIRRGGIKYENNEVSLNQYYPLIPSGVPTRTKSQIETLDLKSYESRSINLNDGDRIQTNRTLGFVRGFIARQKVGDFHDVSEVTVASKVNDSKGAAYRKVFIVLKFHNYFFDVKIKKGEKEDELYRIKRMREILEQGGSLAQPIKNCPCPN